MTLFTTYFRPPLMSETTFQRRLAQLRNEVMQHPHRDELLQLAQDQLIDDTFVLATSVGCPFESGS